MLSSPRVRVALVLLILCFAFGIGVQASFAAKKPKIGFLVDSLKIERWQTDFDSFQKRAQELGAEVVLQDADGSDDLQFNQAKKLLDAHVKALVIVPHDTEKAVRIVELAKSKGVPVLSYDRLIRNTDISFYAGADVVAIGEMQANALLAVAPKGNYVLLDGQKKALKPYVDRGDIKIVAEVWCADWKPAEAYAHITDVLDKNHKQVAAIVDSNDGTAGGAIQALEE